MNNTQIGLIAALLSLSPWAIASPKCEADTFSAETSCIYSTGTIGIAGIGNQIITKNGQMFYQRLVMTDGNPFNVRSILFRVDDRRTIRLSAQNVSSPTVSCTSLGLCTWSWTVIAPISSEVLMELAESKKLIIAVEGEDQRRADESAMKKGGSIFLKFLNDLRANEPEVLLSSKTEAFIQIGSSLIPYTPVTQDEMDQ